MKGRVQPLNKKAWAAKFKNYAVLAGVNQRKKRCHGVRKARVEAAAAYADCTESQMMVMFGWTDSKMPAHYIAQANREKLSFAGMDKIVAFDMQYALIARLVRSCKDGRHVRLLREERPTVCCWQVEKFRNARKANSDILQPLGAIETATEFLVVRMAAPNGIGRFCIGPCRSLQLRITRTDSIPDLLQELNFCQRLINVLLQNVGDSDGEQSEPAGTLSLAGTCG